MWEKYSKNRIIKYHEDGFFILKGVDSQESIPFFCPRCEKPMNKINDCYSYRKNLCCYVCEQLNSQETIDAWSKNIK